MIRIYKPTLLQRAANDIMVRAHAGFTNPSDDQRVLDALGGVEVAAAGIVISVAA